MLFKIILLVLLLCPLSAFLPLTLHNEFKSMSDGINFFNPAFTGNSQEALRWVVDNQLSPSPLGRSVFAEKSLEREIKIGARQYLIFGAGYDTFAYRQPSWANALEIFEIDHPATAYDKQARLKNAKYVIPDNIHYIEADFTEDYWQEKLLNHEAFDRRKISCCAILGVAYYLSKQTFEALISVISSALPKESCVIFDYPDENSYTEKAGHRTKRQSLLAGAANEKMLASYSYAEIEKLLSAHDFLIYEHLNPQKMTEEYFESYNKANPSHRMTAFDNVNYCLAVRK